MRLGLLLALCATSWAQDVTPVQLPEGHVLRDAMYVDVNGDGQRDLVLSAGGAERTLRIHLHPFHVKPTYILAPLFKDVVAFAVADVHTDVGAEVVLFTPKAVWAWRPTAGERERVVKLFACSFLWQLTDDAGARGWPAGVRDLDGDGRDDLIIPEPDGYRIARGGDFQNTRLIVIPAGPAGEGVPSQSLRMRSKRLRERLQLRFSLGAGESREAERRGGPLFEIEDTIPAPQFQDWDADGDLDLIAGTEEWLFVWTQQKGVFSKQPKHALELPVRADRSRRLEVSFSSHIRDLNGDRRADCVIFSGDQRSEDIRTQVQFFVHAKGKPLLAADALPDQLLVLAGFAGDPRLDDIDGDGYPDLLVGAVRPDLMDSLRGSSAKIDADLHVFRNKKGRFSRRPDLTYRTQVEADGLRVRGRTVLARFFADVTGDGIKDMLLRDETRRVRVFPTRRSRRGFSVGEKPMWELRIAEQSTIRFHGKHLLVIEPEQVLVVKFP